ncbi:MAG: hypothetical protein EA421_15020 [Gemmatimonadales bacterium]|nr:MAG: hypothetical protein EA421_15020 [Gemmatimonadales bacterium]
MSQSWPLTATFALPHLLAILAVLAPHPLAAQFTGGTMWSRADTDPLPPRIHTGAGLAVAQAVGEFSEYVSVGAGIQGFLRVELDEGGRVGLRLQGAFLNYGNETQRVCLSATVGCRIEVDLTTSNNIVTVGLGPELALPIGASRLYGNALAGFGYFSTDSQVRGGLDQDPFASSRNYGDGGFSWSAGGGVEIPVARAGALPVSLDLGLNYNGNGRREYLTRGGITDRPDGSLEFDVKRSEADFLIWRIGVSVGLRPGGM